MGGKAAATGNGVVVDHEQITKAHVARIVVMAERERVPAVKPTRVGVETVLGTANVCLLYTSGFFVTLVPPLIILALPASYIA